MKRSDLRKALLLFTVMFAAIQPSGAYSILTHEQVVDLLWKDRIEPLLQGRFPGLTEDDLKKAHAYAYGGSLVQDMGYYPFGSRYFSDLTHYVRTGDFIVCLIQQLQTVNEYAFALGALAHYASDNAGHPMVNRVVAMEFPSLRKKYGDIVTYADSPTAHIRAEFGFDMTQVAKNRYTSDSYHDFIGFEISQELLERVFPIVYGLEFKDVIRDEGLAIGTFPRGQQGNTRDHARRAPGPQERNCQRYTQRRQKKISLLPVANRLRPGVGNELPRPGFGTRFLSLLLKILPKKGPLRGLSFKVPTQAEEDLFVKSIDATVENYGQLLTETKNGTLQLHNLDCDTGRPIQPGEYKLTDLTYAHLLDDLSANGFRQTSIALRDNILDFYKNLNAPQATQHNKKEWKQVQSDLQKLSNAPEMPSQVSPTR